MICWLFDKVTDASAPAVVSLQCFDSIQDQIGKPMFRDQVDTNFDQLIANLSMAVQDSKLSAERQLALFEFLQDFIRSTCTNFTLDNTTAFMGSLVQRVLDEQSF